MQIPPLDGIASIQKIAKNLLFNQRPRTNTQYEIGIRIIGNKAPQTMLADTEVGTGLFNGQTVLVPPVVHLGNCKSHRVSSLHTVAIKDSGAYPSIEETDDQCLKIIELFNSLSVSQIEDRLMNQPSILTLNASAGSPEWHRRCKMIRNLVKLIQGARIKESPYLIDGFSIKDCNGKLCGHIATDPIAKWANAHVIVRKEQYSGLQPDEIRLKVASDLIANLLLDM